MSCGLLVLLCAGLQAVSADEAHDAGLPLYTPSGTQVTVAGNVTNVETGAPIAGAHVVATSRREQGELRVEATSNTRAVFTLRDLELGVWRVVVTAAGHRPTTTDLTVDLEGDLQLLLAMYPETGPDAPARLVDDPSSLARSTPRVSAVTVGPQRPPAGGPPPGRGPPGGRPPGGRPPGGGPPGGGPPGGGPPPGGRPPGGGPPGGMPPGGRPGGPPGGIGGPGGAATTAQSTINDVTTAVDNASGMALRGLDPGATQVLFDGIEVPLLLHGGNLRPVVPAQLIEGAEFYTGSFPSELSRATGGVVAMTPRTALPERLSGSVELSTADGNAELRAPLGQGMGVAAGGQFSVLDRVVRAVVPTTQPTTLSALPRYWDAHAQWLYRPAPEVDVQVLGLVSSDRWVDAFATNTDGSAAPLSISREVLFWRTLGTARWVPSRALETSLVVGGGQDVFAASGYRVTVGRLTARPSVRWRAAPSFSLLAGLDAHLERPSGTVSPSVAPAGARLAGDTALLPRTVNTLGAHVKGTWEPLDGLSFEPGLRVDVGGSAGTVTADPRLLARLRLLSGRVGASSLALRGGVGLHHRPPALLQTDPTIGNRRSALRRRSTR